MSPLIIAIVILFVMQLLAFVLVLATARQVGVLLVRLGPQPRRTLNQGPATGSILDTRHVGSVDGRSYSFGAVGRWQLLIFVSPGCRTCTEMIPGLMTMMRSRPDLLIGVLSGSDRTPADLNYASQIRPLPYFCAPDYVRELHVDATPYGVVVDDLGRVHTKSVINHLEDMEGLFATLIAGWNGANPLDLNLVLQPMKGEA